ncbi:hypothetical protein BDZ89DRAFT_1063945 [Hymenopellis radicata]|nr:hypothetical protein BDZ89DRAFT_1063945 [Hymenopellis radicata]
MLISIYSSCNNLRIDPARRRQDGKDVVKPVLSKTEFVLHKISEIPTRIVTWLLQDFWSFWSFWSF